MRDFVPKLIQKHDHVRTKSPAKRDKQWVSIHVLLATNWMSICTSPHSVFLDCKYACRHWQLVYMLRSICKSSQLQNWATYFRNCKIANVLKLSRSLHSCIGIWELSSVDSYRTMRIVFYRTSLKYSRSYIFAVDRNLCISEIYNSCV